MTIKLIVKEDLNPNSFVNDNTYAKGGISIAISPDAGNLLNLRDNGLYYGIVAEKKINNLYVANEGDDSAEGTRANPLRTIREAFSRQKIGTSFTINLKEGQIHEWRSSWGNAISRGKQFTIRTYGESVDLALINNVPNSAHYQRSKEINRATIKFIVDSSYAENVAKASVFDTSNPISGFNAFYMVILDTNTDVPDNMTFSSSFTHYFGSSEYNQNLVFRGCKFILHDKVCLMNLGAGNNYVRIDTCQFDNSKGNAFIKISLGTLSLDITGYSQVDGTPYNDYLHSRATPAKEEWKPLISGITGIQSANVITNAFS